MKLRFREKVKEESFDNLRKMVEHIYQNADHKKINQSQLIIGGLIFLTFLIAILFLWQFNYNSIYYLFTIVFLGIISVPLILVIGHESIHGNFSNGKRINKIGQGVFYFLGTSPYFWKLRHLNAHHHYTNIKKWDLDIEQSELIRLNNNQKWRKIHSFQAYYMPILFTMYTLNWFFLRDFKDIKKNKFGNKYIKSHAFSNILWLFASKCWHLSFLIFIPVLLGQSMSMAILGFFVFHFSASLTTTLVLVSTHIGEDHELVDIDTQTNLPYSWIEHQIRTSGSFNIKSRFVLHFFGGFNHHLAHHLFPNVPYVLYPKITQLIEEYCVQNNLPFVCYPNLFVCIRSHFKRLVIYSKNNN